MNACEPFHISSFEGALIGFTNIGDINSHLLAFGTQPERKERRTIGTVYAGFDGPGTI